jgi:hypothetical protein
LKYESKEIYNKAKLPIISPVKGILAACSKPPKKASVNAHNATIFSEFTAELFSLNSK